MKLVCYLTFAAVAECDVMLLFRCRCSKVCSDSRSGRDWIHLLTVLHCNGLHLHWSMLRSVMNPPTYSSTL